MRHETSTIQGRVNILAWTMRLIPLACIVPVSAQPNNLWVAGNQFIRFPSTVDEDFEKVPLPIPGSTVFCSVSLPADHLYQGQVPTWSQNVVHDGQGNLLLFEVDGNVYNADGLLIGDAAASPAMTGEDCQVCLHPGLGMSFIPVTGYCGRYLVISVIREPVTGSLSSYRLRAALLDLGLESDMEAYQGLTIPVMGKFLNILDSDYGLDINAGTTIWYPQPVLGSNTPLDSYAWDHEFDYTDNAPVSFDVIALENDDRHLLVVRGGDGLYAFFIQGTQVRQFNPGAIPAHYTWTSWDRFPFAVDHQFQPGPDPVFYYNVLDGLPHQREYRSQLAMHQSGANLSVAYSGYRFLPATDEHRLQVVHWEFGLPSPGNPSVLSFNPVPGVNPRIYAVDQYPTSDQTQTDFQGNIVPWPAVGGLRYSPNGQRLLFTKSSQSIGSTLGSIDLVQSCPTGIGDVCWANSYLLTSSPTTGRKLVDTRLAMGPSPDGSGQALYMLGAEVDDYWLGALSEPDNPDDANWDPSLLVLGNLCIRTDPGNPVEYRMLNDELRGSTHHQVLQDPICCQALVEMRDRSSTITSGCVAQWSPGSNPFFNTTMPIYIATELRIATGVSISATNMEFRFAPDAVMVIEPGALFLSNNCTFTAACGGTWKGIRVEGTTSNWLQQSAFQGRLYLEPGSIVEYAEVGAWTARELPNGLADPQRFGGRIRTNGAKFVNCRTGVLIERFHRRLPGTSLELNNLSSISNTGFFTTENWMGGGNPYAHVYLYDVNGISVSNSRFANEGYELFAPNDRGWGLVGLDAAFTCTGTDENDHYFQSLSVGVIGSTPDLLERYVVNNMTFKDNVMGIADLACTGSRITRNRFSLLDDDNEVSYGVLLFSSELYTVERNHFGRALGTGAGYVGINFMGSALADNQVYDNTFEKLTVGNWVQGQQRNPNFPMEIASGLQMRCGTHIDNVVTHFYTDEAVVRMEQGLPFLGVQFLANNEHLSTPACDLNDPQSASFHPLVLAFQPYDFFVNYNYYDFTGSPEQRPSCVEDDLGNPETFIGDWFYDLVDFQVALPFDKERDCDAGILDIEENFQGLMAASLTTEYQQSTAALSSALSTYMGTVDMGQKVDLLEALRQYPTIPSHELRDVLLVHHPLSDEVLKETIYRPEPLDNWHLTQVLIANSPLNGWVFQALDEADSLPSYYRHLVKQAQAGEIGVKRLLELEILQRQQEKELLLTRLIHTWASDTIHAERADTVLALLRMDESGYGIQSTYIQKILQGNQMDVSSLVGDLNASPWNTDLLEYGNLLAQAEGVWINLVGNEVALRRMAFDHSPGSGALAWGALLAMQELDSVPMPHLPVMLKSLMPQRRDRSELHDVIPISVLPNPASNRIAFVTPMHDGLSNGVLEIFDSHGRWITTIALSGRRGLIESSVEGWAPGLYLVRLVVDGTSLGNAKFTVVR